MELSVRRDLAWKKATVSAAFGPAFVDKWTQFSAESQLYWVSSAEMKLSLQRDRAEKKATVAAAFGPAFVDKWTQMLVEPQSYWFELASTHRREMAEAGGRLAETKEAERAAAGGGSGGSGHP